VNIYSGHKLLNANRGLFTRPDVESRWYSKYWL